MAARIESALFAAYLAILVWAPLPFASYRIWGGALLALLVGIVLAGWLVLYLSGRARPNLEVLGYAALPLALLLQKSLLPQPLLLQLIFQLL